MGFANEQFGAGAARLGQNRSGNWEIRWTEPDANGRARTRTHSCRTSDRNVAQEVYRAWLSVGAAAVQVGTAPTVRETLDRYAEGYLDMQNIGPSQRWSLVHFRAPGSRLGDCLVTDLEDERPVNDYIKARRKLGIADSTIRRELGALRAALTWAQKNKVVDKTLDLQVPLTPSAEGRENYLSVADEARLFEVARERFYSDLDFRFRRGALFVMLALDTAARMAAIRGLTWDRVDLALGRIDYRDPGMRRTKKRRVPVPISARLLPVLQRAWTDRALGVGGAEAQGPHVLGHSGSVRKAVEGLQAGFNGKTESDRAIRECTIHDMRRTWATLAAQRGVPLWQVAGMLGDTLETVQKHYAHHSPEYLADAVKR